jgi:hypothetical protein
MAEAQGKTRWPARRLACVLLPACMLAGCGGGFSLYYGGDYDGWAPSVSLAAAHNTVVAGQMVRLVAAAADENGIEYVEFYRLDGGAAVLLGSDPTPPYEWDAVAPDDGRALLRVFARATDRAGNWADSNTVSISIVR